MIFWKPRTEAEKKLLELYGVEENETQDHNPSRSQGNRKGRNPGQEFDKGGVMGEEEICMAQSTLHRIE